MLNNPIAGGPNFIEVLRNALEKVPNAYTKPPPTGGTQISVRFGDDRLAILDGIEKHSGWNRSQIINALVDRGLYELFSRVSDQVVEVIMASAADRVVPTFDRSADIGKQLASAFNRFRIHPTPQVVRSARLNEPTDKTWLLARIDGNAGTFVLQDESVGWLLHLHFSHIEKLHRDTVRDSKSPFKNCLLELNVQVVMEGQELKLVPIPRAGDRSNAL
jgi:hypothetical protein